MNPQNRIDKSSWKVIIPDVVKRRDQSVGHGFCNGHPVGSAHAMGGKEVAVWWPGNTPVLITSAKYKEARITYARGNAIAGVWSTGKGSKEGAIVWSFDKSGLMKDTDLHDPSRYTGSAAMATTGGVHVGSGDPKAKGKRWQDIKTVGLVWRDEANAVELPAPATVDVSVNGTDGESHVGAIDGGIAVVWRGEKSQPIELGPKDAASQALAVHDQEQVGVVWRKGEPHAALWKGTATSLVDLTPRGFAAARAQDCAQGFQTGLVKKRERLSSGFENLESRAVLWNGSNAYFDLQDLLPNPWNASSADHIEISDDMLRICGTAYQVVTTGSGKEAYPSLAGSTIVVWECKLRG